MKGTAAAAAERVRVQLVSLGAARNWSVFASAASSAAASLSLSPSTFSHRAPSAGSCRRHACHGRRASEGIVVKQLMWARGSGRMRETKRLRIASAVRRGKCPR
eukprot:1489403-Pleurochrysis_carterae.AAC.2